ncbi:hypothetical protein Taro_006453 [Colocasia esculenta]|uniref:Helicase C-terminal domain-containing protein n=1 Tax=Colocasia esculenta TaxID=4460 RepID=A0A843TSJ1_COLES|nr:hypothetical protein [Colocasia esculenta]
MLKGPDILSARAGCRGSESMSMDSEACSESEKKFCTSHNDSDDDDDNHDCSGSSSGGDVAENGENLDECNDGGISAKTLKMLSYQETGIAKLSGFCEWFSNHFMVNNTEIASSLDMSLASQKMIVFAHHIKVLDGIQEFVCGKGIQFVRIDGSTLPRDRQIAVESFRSSKEVKIAIIGITAGGVGLDFSSAQNVVFLELPKSASEMLQAEDRAHRRGQTNAVNIYIFCAKNTSDESQWLHLNKSLYRVSSMMNGKCDAIKEIEVDRVYHLYSRGDPCYCVNPETSSDIPEHGTSDNWRVQGHNKDNPESQDRCSQQTDTTMSCSAPTNTRVLEVETTNGQDRGGSSGLPVSLESKALDSLENRNSGSLCLSRMGKEIGDDGSSMSEAFDVIIGTDMEQTEADVDACFPADSLRFEVSQYTGRIHLYVCVLGKDSRPRPLFENFRPEEVDLMCLALDTRKEVDQQLVKRTAAYWEVVNSFTKEWNGLRPVEQKKLLGKPLQLPLELELCYLKGSINHGCGSIEGHFFSGILAKRPEFFEDLFCNLSCFQEFRIRTSQRFLREALFQIEHGVCAICKLDCHRLVKCIKPLSIERRQEYVLNMAPKLANKRKL